MLRNLARIRLVIVCLALALRPTHASSGAKVAGYLEFRKPTYLIVDAQRVEITPKTKLHAGKAKTAADIPLGWEIHAKGTRAADGTY